MSAERIVLRQKWKAACKEEGERAFFEEYLVSAGLRDKLSVRVEKLVRLRELAEDIKRLRRVNAPKPMKVDYSTEDIAAIASTSRQVRRAFERERAKDRYPYKCAAARAPYIEPEERKAKLEAHPFEVPEVIHLYPTSFADPGTLKLAPLEDRVLAAAQAEIPVEFVRLGVNPITGAMPRDHVSGGDMDWPSLYSANRARVLEKNERRRLRKARKQRRGWA